MSIYGIKYDNINSKKSTKGKFNFNEDKNNKLNMFKQCQRNIKSTNNQSINSDDNKICNINKKSASSSEEKLLKEIKSLKENLKKEKDKRKLCENKNKELKLKINKYNKEIQELNKNICSLKEENNLYIDNINNKNKELSDLNYNIKQLKKRKIYLDDRNNHLRQVVGNLNRQNKNLNNKIKNITKYRDLAIENANVNNINELNAKVKFIKKKYKELLINYEALLESIGNEITEDIIKDYNEINNQKYYIGYVNIDDYGNCTFISDDIEIPIENIGVPSGTVCKVTNYTGNEYKIVKLFDGLTDKKISKKNKKSIRKNKIVEKLENKYPDFNTDKKILIIGNRFKNIYLKGLRGLKLNVDWISSNNESLFRICSKLDKYDIVIICIDSVEHSLINYVKNMDLNNIFELKKDTFDNMIYKINYALENIK